jgi:hypothetical protein
MSTSAGIYRKCRYIYRKYTRSLTFEKDFAGAVALGPRISKFSRFSK